MDSHSRRIGGGSADFRRRLRNWKPVAAAVRRRTTDPNRQPQEPKDNHRRIAMNHGWIPKRAGLGVDPPTSVGGYGIGNR